MPRLRRNERTRRIQDSTYMESDIMIIFFVDFEVVICLYLVEIELIE